MAVSTSIQSDQYERLFGRVLRWSIAIPIILIFSVVGLLVWRVSAMVTANREIIAIAERIGYAQQSYRLIIDMETGFRGYLLTKDQTFLAPYREATPELPAVFAKLRTGLENGNPSQLGQIDAIEERFADWNRAIQTALLTQKVDPIAFSERKRAMDSIRQAIGDYIKSEEAAQIAGLTGVQDATERAFVLTIGLGLFAAIILAFFTRRQLGSVSSIYSNAIAVQKKAEAELRSYNDRLEEQVARRTTDLTESNNTLLATNEELEAFCYSVSHDLRAPLRGIDGFSQALLEDYGQTMDASGRQFLDFIREGVQKMGQLIDDLLELSRLTRAPMNKQQVDLSVLARSTAARLTKQATAGSRIKIDIVAQAVVDGDEGLLGVMIENLFSNAIKFSEKVAAPQIEFGRDDSQSGAPYFVRDNGAGFDMAYADKLFGAFQRLHSASEFRGIGVGLATVRRIVSRHGGRVWGLGKPGQGATFYFTLTADPTGDLGEKQSDSSSRG